MGWRWLLPVTPEVASSSLVGPANPFKSVTYIDQSVVRPTGASRRSYLQARHVCESS
jgi:hypothetical protein